MVELKREWIDPKEIARKIAGHANAARGEKILWLIGVDEKGKEKIIGAEPQELSNWYARVEARFDEIAPRMTPLKLRVLYDTNVILYILRQADSIDKLQRHLNTRYLDEYISVVTVAEIRSLAIQFNWGEMLSTLIMIYLPKLEF